MVTHSRILSHAFPVALMLLGCALDSIENPPDIQLLLVPNVEQLAEFRADRLSHGDWSFAYEASKPEAGDCVLSIQASVLSKEKLVAVSGLREVRLPEGPGVVSGGKLGAYDSCGYGDHLVVTMKSTCNLTVRVMAEVGQYEG